MKKFRGKAQPKLIYKRNITSGIAFCIFSLIMIIPLYANNNLDTISIIEHILAYSGVIIGILCFISCLFRYETFYITDDYIVIKNCFKKLKMIKKSDIKHIYVESVIIGGNFGRSFFWQYIVISESPKSSYKEDIYRPYLNAKYRKEITIDFSCKNEDIINEWTENKFDLYN